MEVAPTETGMKAKSYSMNMSKDFIPMCVFSEANQGKDQKLDFLINRIRYTQFLFSALWELVFSLMCRFSCDSLECTLGKCTEWLLSCWSRLIDFHLTAFHMIVKITWIDLNDCKFEIGIRQLLVTCYAYRNCHVEDMCYVYVADDLLLHQLRSPITWAKLHK